MHFTYTHTRAACYTGYIVQAIVNNLPPLLYATFHAQLGIPLWQLSILISVNFVLQLTVDLLSTVLIDRLGYRGCVVGAHVSSAAGMICLGVLPFIMPPFLGILLSTALMALGGGMIEVIISPMVEALPSKSKSGGMALLHSFYCWGQAAVVLVSTLLLFLIPGMNWRWLPLVWAVIPACNAYLLLRVPIQTLDEEKGKAMPLRELFTSKLFYLFCALMICAGASEIAISQWGSYFAERSLGLKKVVGDIAGPCAFACLMGVGRVCYSIFRKKISLPFLLCVSGASCIACYLVISLSPLPLVSLIACALCGLTVSMMWPGVYSMSSRRIPHGGTAMFALLAFSGDVGCAASPTLMGLLSGNSDAGLSRAFLYMAVFPVLFFLCSFVLLKRKRVLGAPEDKEPQQSDTKNKS